jgi:hypothetical protein
MLGFPDESSDQINALAIAIIKIDKHVHSFSMLAAGQAGMGSPLKNNE